jgi:hypothetical protein
MLSALSGGMRLSLSFAFDDGRIVEVDTVRALVVQDYVFNGAMRPTKALVVNDTAYELRLVSDLRLSVHTGA